MSGSRTFSDLKPTGIATMSFGHSTPTSHMTVSFSSSSRVTNLTDYENAEKITPEIYDNLVATGFLRMVPDPTWFNVTGFVPNRLDVVADAVGRVRIGSDGLDHQMCPLSWAQVRSDSPARLLFAG